MPSVKELVSYIKLSLKEIVEPNELQQFVWLIFDYLRSYTRLDLILKEDRQMSVEEIDFIYKAVERLKEHEPLQYVLGQTHFMNLIFKVNKHVLIPRPETEELVTWILEENAACDNNHLKILDLGTGSGCIPVSLKKFIPYARVEAWDVSLEALAIAKENALFHGEEIDFKQRNILDYSTFSLSSMDIIISNPPYVTQKEQKVMAPNVLNYEPHLALFVPDNDPLMFYKAITDFAKECLNPNGRLYFEINEAYGREVCEILQHSGFSSIELRKDLSNRNRMVRAILPVVE